MKPVPSLEELKQAAREIVKNAKKKGQLSSLTPRVVRENIEGKYGLESGTLNNEDYRRPLKMAIKEAAGEAKKLDANVTQKQESAQGRHDSAIASMSTASAHQDVRKFSFDDLPKGNSKEPSSNAKKCKKVEPKKEFKSAEFINDSSGGEEKDAPRPDSSARICRPDVESGAEVSDGMAENPRKSTCGAKSFETGFDRIVNSSNQKSSEQKRESKGIQKGKGKMKLKQDLSKDEVTLKKLKSFVTACGVRKVWSKVFRDCDQTSQQISKLKEILDELGMKGKYSLEQARKIREKRELAQELEDVQIFEKSILRSGKRASTIEDSDSETEVKPVKRKRTALQSITAFLDDQTDSDE